MLITVLFISAITLLILYKFLKAGGEPRELSLKEAYDYLQLGMGQNEVIKIMNRCASSHPLKKYSNPSERSKKIWYWKEAVLDGQHYLKIVLRNCLVRDVEFYDFPRRADAAPRCHKKSLEPLE